MGCSCTGSHSPRLSPGSLLLDTPVVRVRQVLLVQNALLTMPQLYTDLYSKDIKGIKPITKSNLAETLCLYPRVKQNRNAYTAKKLKCPLMEWLILNHHRLCFEPRRLLDQTNLSVETQSFLGSQEVIVDTVGSGNELYYCIAVFWGWRGKQRYGPKREVFVGDKSAVSPRTLWVKAIGTKTAKSTRRANKQNT